MEFLAEYGAEMMVEIFRFWASIAHFDKERDRYEIHGVMGSDEFHEKYPGSKEEGLRNNAYTNAMVARISHTVRKMLDELPERRRKTLASKIALTEEETKTWEEMSRRMFVPFHQDGDGEEIISQFEDYEALEDLDWDAYREKYGNIQRLDRILKAEGDDPDRYKLAKQADTVLLFFLFSEDEIREVFERLGYEYSPEMARRNVEYYDERTSHGSTLSFIVHAGILAGMDPESLWKRHMVALESDAQSGATQEGIHLGVMAGTLDLIQRSYLGTSVRDGVRDGVLRFDPRPVEGLEGVSFPMQVRGVRLEVSIEGGKFAVRVADDPGKSIKVDLGDGARTLEAGESRVMEIQR